MTEPDKLRFECLRLAVTIGLAHKIAPEKITPLAETFVRFVGQDPRRVLSEREQQALDAEILRNQLRVA